MVGRTGSPCCMPQATLDAVDRVILAKPARAAQVPPELPSAEAPRSRLRLRLQQPLARRGGMAPPRRRRCPPGPGRRSTTFRG